MYYILSSVYGTLFYNNILLVQQRIISPHTYNTSTLSTLSFYLKYNHYNTIFMIIVYIIGFVIEKDIITVRYGTRNSDTL